MSQYNMSVRCSAPGLPSRQGQTYQLLLKLKEMLRHQGRVLESSAPQKPTFSIIFVDVFEDRPK